MAEQWYALHTLKDRSRVEIPGTQDAEFLKSGQNMYTNLHRKLTVKRVETASTDEPALRVTLTKPLSKRHHAGEVMYFTTDKNFAKRSLKKNKYAKHADREQQIEQVQAQHYPTIPGMSGAAARSAVHDALSKKSVGLADLGSGSSDSDDSLLGMNRKMKKKKHKSKKDKGSSSGGGGGRSSRRKKKKHGGGGGGGGSSSNKSSDLAILSPPDKDDEVLSLSVAETKSTPHPMVMWLMFMIVHAAVLLSGFGMSMYVGSFRVWTAVIGVVFLGYQFVAIVASFVVNCIASRWTHSAEKSAQVTNFILLVLNFIFLLSMGIPLAWANGRQTAALNWLDSPMTKQVSCWRQPNMTFNQFDTAYIVFNDREWDVDYATGHNQKIAEDIDPGDNPPSSTKTYYSYIVAPMVYRGNVPCSGMRIWAACFAMSKGKKFLSVKPNSKEAKACGWTLPSTAVVMRVVNVEEMFGNFADKEDVTFWKKAWIMTGQGHVAGPKKSVFAWYGAESPDDMLKEFYAAEKAAQAIEICYLSIGLGILAIVSCVLSLSSSDDRGSGCCSDCDCDCCDCD